MGHLAMRDPYERIREKLDRMPVGAPGRKTIYEILKTMYTPEEAELAAQMPLRFSTLSQLSTRLHIPSPSLQTKLEAMADKGLIFDVRFGRQALYMLTPTVVGFFEFSMMRTRQDLDQKRLAQLYHRYIVEERDFTDQFSPNTQVTPFRTLVHESSLPSDFTEILDWEKANWLIRNSPRFAVGLCHCRHGAHHRGHDCQKIGMESCLTIGGAVDYITRHGFGREIERSQALDLLSESRDKGMVHMADNVQHHPTFICNCCSCCCEVLAAFRHFKTFGNTFSSNFEAHVYESSCSGCKKCQKACPVEAIEMIEQPRIFKDKQVKWLPKVNFDLCIGCGVCALQCQEKSIHMQARPKRRLVPEDTFSRVLLMAMEQGKLHQLLVDKDRGLVGLAANTLLGAILKLPPTKQLLAQESLRSHFLAFLMRGLKESRRKTK